MNYSKRGIKNKQRELNAFDSKIGRKVGILILKLVLGAVVMAVVCGVAGGLGVFKSILANTPTIYISDIVATGQATIVYDAEGNEIDQYVSADSNRIEVEWDEISPYLPLAFVAIEDERFYEHNGIDYKGLMRAGYQFIKTKGDEKQGASTITQQLLKNTVFTSWTDEGDNLVRQVKRKIQEQYLAIEVTKNTEKDDILLRYMNVINLGQNTLGVESASQRYFGKSAIDLTLSESAVIACITQNPSFYNPIRYPDKNVKRRETCLNNMLRLEYITQAEYDEAIADTEAVYERIGYHNTELLETNIGISSYFSDAVYEKVLEDLIATGYDKTQAEHMLNAGGLRIYTTMDPTIQAIMDEEFANPDNYSSEVHWYLNYALTITDNNNEQHNYSKEKMTKWFKEQGKTGFNLIFASQEAAYEAIETYKAACYEELGVVPSDSNFDESITLTAQPQVAMVIEDQATGHVVAMVGGRGTKEGRRTLNRATNALRSPGSTFKVVASFAPAVDSGLATLATTFNDAPFNYDGGRAVKNWWGTGSYRDICSIRDAVRDSLNIIAVKCQTVIGPRLGYDYLAQLGFTTLTDGVVINGDVYSDVNQTLALGGLTYGVSPYELNAAYAALANGGEFAETKVYTLVTDADGNIIIDNRDVKSHRVFKETTAWLMTSAMNDVVTKGTGGIAAFSGQYIAGKTGTSSDYKDVWFAGYTPYYTATVWTGYDNNIGMSTSSANNESAISKKMWRAVMQRVHQGLEYKSFEMPEDITVVTVCRKSGMLATELCNQYGCAYNEYFEKGTEPGAVHEDDDDDNTNTNTVNNPDTNPEDTEGNYPAGYCMLHYSGWVCGYSGQIACETCPFATLATVEMPLPEEPALVSGSTIISKDENGNDVYSTPVTSYYCPHDASFYANPDYENIINQQRAQMEAAAAAAAAAAGY